MHAHTDFLLVTLSYLIAATSAYRRTRQDGDQSFEAPLVDCRWIDFRSWYLVDALRRNARTRYIEGCDLLVPTRFSIGHHRDGRMYPWLLSRRPSYVP